MKNIASSVWSINLTSRTPDNRATGQLKYAQMKINNIMKSLKINNNNHDEITM
jgi:hypothetical protein